MMLKHITWLAAAAITIASPARAQSPQDRLWDAAMAGDTIAIASALGAGAVVDSLDTRTATNGRRALNWPRSAGMSVRSVFS